MLKGNNSILTVIVDETEITQELLNIMIERATNNPSVKYSIGILSLDPPSKYEIINNLSIYLNYRTVENKIIN